MQLSFRGDNGGGRGDRRWVYFPIQRRAWYSRRMPLEVRDTDTQVGPTQWIRMWTAPGDTEPHGFLFLHMQPGNPAVLCDGGMISFQRWTLHSLDPLHVEPSLLCTRCGEHGYIRDGKWVDAR